MLKSLMTRLKQGSRTMAWPDGPPPPMPDRFRGAPRLNAALCPTGCQECVEACPTGAVGLEAGQLKLDLGRCLFCVDCIEACPQGAIAYTTDHRMATRARDDLVLISARPGEQRAAEQAGDRSIEGPPGAHSDDRIRGARAGGVEGERALKLAGELEARTKRLFGRSLKLRQVSASGCNGCESDVNVLSTIVWDLGRFGIQFVASPRHADGLLITGAVSENMKLALEKAYAAVPSPKLVIAVGACAISGGPYVDHPEVCNGVEGLLPVDLYVPGCPPHPLTILDGLLRLLGRLEE